MQKTQKDHKADLIIRAKIDDVSRAVARALHIDVAEHVLRETHVVTVKREGTVLKLLVGAPSSYDHPTVLSQVTVSGANALDSPIGIDPNDDGNFALELPLRDFTVCSICFAVCHAIAT